MWRTIPVIVACLLIFSCALSKGQSFPEPGSTAYKRMNRQGMFSFSAGLGVSSYFGDLKGRQSNILAKPSTNLGLQYKVNNHLVLRTEVIWYRIAGADSLNDVNSSIYNRNLSFRADNIEWSLVSLYQWFNKYSQFNTHLLNPYGFIGIGVTSVNPLAFYNGAWYNLRPLETEGIKYGSFAVVVPFGLGIAYAVNDSWDIAIEYGYRYSFSDYLDDVSRFHIGTENTDDPVRKALSDRRPEKGIESVRAGYQRGNDKVNDWYLIGSVKATFTPQINNRKPVFR